MAQQLSGGGDPKEGQQLLASYGCGSCHDIPGVRDATGRVGPPLGSVVHRSFVAGVLPVSADNLVRWITDPQGVDSLTAMPELGVSPQEARSMVAYLYLLGER